MTNQATPPGEDTTPDDPQVNPDVARRIAEAAARANAEAEARRRQDAAIQLPPELGGPKGPEPTRYGDWERKGIVSDF
jgi:hypothetical protein